MAEDHETEHDNEDGDEGLARIPAHELKQLRQKAKKADDGEAARRELTFVKAGIDTDSAVGKLFMRAYDGDLDVDKVKAAAAEIPGVLATAEPATTTTDGDAGPELEEGEAGSTVERRALAGTTNPALPDNGAGVDPRRAAAEAAEEAMRKGATEEVALGGYFNALANAAHNGDRRAVVGGDR